MPPEHSDDKSKPPAELPGDSHLQPVYRPPRDSSNPDLEEGRIHLEGEFDFPVDQPPSEIADSLAERAEIIGGLVTHSRNDGHIQVHPWNGPGFFRLIYDPDTPDPRIEAIAVFDRNDKMARFDNVAALKEPFK
jgi:hypothetical protein